MSAIRAQILKYKIILKTNDRKIICMFKVTIYVKQLTDLINIVSWLVSPNNLPLLNFKLHHAIIR